MPPPLPVEHAIFPMVPHAIPKAQRKHICRVARIDLHIARANVLIAVQHLFECFAAIDGIDKRRVLR